MSSQSKKAYEAYLQAQRDIEKEQEKKRIEAAAQKEKSSEKIDLEGELKQAKQDLDTFRTGINAALAVVMEGNEEMGKCLAGNAPGTMNTMKMSQAKVTMGLKRKGSQIRRLL